MKRIRIRYDLIRFRFCGQGWQRLFQSASKIRQGFGHGLVEGMRAVAIEVGVDFFEASDEVEDLVSRVGTSSGCAEMRAATKGAGFVDQAAGGFGIKQRAVSVVGLGQVFAASGAEGFSGNEGFAACEAGDFPCEMELAAFGAEAAISLQWTRGEFSIDLMNLGDSCRL
jgi:hypothetical protein